MKSRMIHFGSAIGLAMIAASVWAQDPPTPPPATPPAPTPPSAEQDKPKTEYVQLTIGGAIKGEIILELNRDKAPLSVDNFMSYVNKKFYDGTIFHRVMPTFMIQGGGFTPDMQQKPTDPAIKNEWRNGLKNARGTVAMARLGDRQPNPSTVDSATAQFFINVVDNPRLDQPQPDGGAYAVFGKVVAGMDVVDAIKAVPTHTHPAGHQNVPTQPVIIEKAARLSAEDAKKKIDAANAPKPAAPSSSGPSTTAPVR